MNKNISWTFGEFLFALFAIAFVLFVHGAVPFLMMPTLGQAVWSMGFSQSFANGALFDLYAHDFGIPKPAAIAFGLSGAWPASILIRLGLHAADAYAGMAALWLGLAMFSAYQISRRFGATTSVALVGAVAWMSMPIIWAHAGYSMLSWGIALLSFYFLAAFKLFLIESESGRIAPTSIALYFVATIVSVFMDGYTFMMFATGASILLLYVFVTRPENRPTLIKMAVPVHVASFALAYILFTRFIGKSSFEAQSIDFFRGWGLDLSFIAIPTKGVFWLSDLLGLNLERSNEFYFGDSSVWKTTFALPVLLLGSVAWFLSRRQTKIATGVLFVAIFGFYMATGPSLKINSVKPESLRISHPRDQSVLMAPEFAVTPTGNAWISEGLPGFKVMRASYRWSALGIFALWLLIMIWVSRTERKNKRIWLFGLVAMILFNLPNLQKNWQMGSDNRVMFKQIDDELVMALKQTIRAGEVLAFVPWGNDFIANYLAPKAGFHTFNIGGDKNLAAAQSGWPPEMLALGGGSDVVKASIAVNMLINGSADALVLPYFNMLWSPHLWPCVDQTTAKLDTEQRESFRKIPGFICPDEKKAELHSFIAALRESPYVNVSEFPLFSTVRLRPEFSGAANRSALLGTLLSRVQYPILLSQEFTESPYVLREGWHAMEAHHVWSQAAAKLILPVPKRCETNECHAVLKLSVFGASPQRPVSLIFSSTEQGWQWTQKVVSDTSDTIEVVVPLTGAKGSRGLSVSIPEATSPQALSGSLDSRVLGIALYRIELLNN